MKRELQFKAYCTLFSSVHWFCWLACNRLTVGMLVVATWPESCTSQSPACHHLHFHHLCWWWWLDWSLVRLRVLAVTISTSIISCCSSSRTVWHSDIGLSRLSWKLTIKTVFCFIRSDCSVMLNVSNFVSNFPNGPAPCLQGPDALHVDW